MARRRGISIPEDIIAEEIVPRLPMESVGRCRCVCKRWRSLFSDPDFAKSYTRSLSFRQQKLAFHRRDDEFYSLPLELGMQQPLVSLSPPPFKKPENSLSFVGSCNGLVACVTEASIKTGIPSLLEDMSLFIWNPLTGFYKEFLGPGFNFTVGGFGHVSATDDYKFVALHDHKYMREVRVYSLKNQTWKTIEFPPNLRLGNQLKGVLLNEALHWFVYETDRDVDEVLGEPVVLFAFDLAKEEYRKIQLPSSARDFRYDRRLSGSLEGCLYVMRFRNFHIRRDTMPIEFWVMREYGNSCSWQSSSYILIPKFITIDLEPVSHTETCAVVMNKSKKSDILVLERGNNIRRNDCEDKQELPEELCKIHHRTGQDSLNVYIVETDLLDMMVYEETLISLR